MKHFYIKRKKVDAFNLQEVLVTLVIIGILILLAFPSLSPMVSKTKSLEAQMQLKYLYNTQTMYRYMHSKYSFDFSELDFEAPKTINENGTSNYKYEIVNASNNSFKAIATAISDFDGDGIFNVWQIDENGIPKQITKD
ncbi:prepilin-type N-terminal cleavage/methylation domain-containing protein [Pontimicrobium sp. IMCC45349]|uniref:prepilin-type N-terminal cleavage/methylation domain-containing protein n=1 Tax=Pontimicrobium sp. IMCC45349 TaxID=3391574 RepID=UPI00399FEA7F